MITAFYDRAVADLKSGLSWFDMLGYSRFGNGWLDSEGAQSSECRFEPTKSFAQSLEINDTIQLEVRKSSIGR